MSAQSLVPELHVVLVPSAQVIILGFPKAPEAVGLGLTIGLDGGIRRPGLDGGIRRPGLDGGIRRPGLGRGMGPGLGGIGPGVGLGIAPSPGKKFDSGPVISLERFQKAVGATVPGK